MQHLPHRAPSARRLHLLVALGSLASAGIAQVAVHSDYARISVAPRFAGTYHVATGTWTRGAAQSLAGGVGSDIVFNNTVTSGYYARMNVDQTWTASGRLPSTTSPAVPWDPTAMPVGSQPGSAVGCAESYTIDGFQIAYCSELAGPNTAMTIAFHQSWVPLCSAITGATQGGPFALTGLPGRPIGAPIGCWTLNIDLAGSTASFTMLADGDGAYDANTDDAFAWSLAFPSMTTTFRAGPWIAGGPSDGSGPAHPGLGWKQGGPATMEEAAGYDGTRFDGPVGAMAPTYPANGAVGLPSPSGEPGSDAIGDDAFRIDDPAQYLGCRHFGGPMGSGPISGPYANFHLELYAKVNCATSPQYVEYCAGDGIDPQVATVCPCSNFGGVGRGCASSFNALGAHLGMSGTFPNVALDGTGMNATGNCIFLKGDANVSQAVVFGDGIRCADGALIRLRTVALAAGAASFPDSTTTLTLEHRGGTPAGSGLTGYYSVYYRNASAAFCPPATFNASNGTQLTW